MNTSYDQSDPRHEPLDVWVCPECGSCFESPTRFCPHDGMLLRAGAPPEGPGSDPLVGRVIDQRYRVQQLLGEGGMGSVYRVRHTTLGRSLALKALRPELAADAVLAERFLREARSAAAVQHPSICEITDFGMIDGTRPYFVMELLTGDSLRAQLARREPFALSKIARVTTRIARALQAAHEAGVIHRDLKPENVVIENSSGDDSVKVVDFGLATLEGHSRLTRPGLVYGTPHYMSPEQASGGTVDHRTDIYSLGVILFELCVGRVPFDAETYMGVLSKHMYEPSPRPTREGMPMELSPMEPIIQRCLQKDPTGRYESMRELASAVEEMWGESSVVSADVIERRWSERPTTATPAPRDTEPGPAPPVAISTRMLLGAGLTLMAGGAIPVLLLWPATASEVTEAAAPSETTGTVERSAAPVNTGESSGPAPPNLVEPPLVEHSAAAAELAVKPAFSVSQPSEQGGVRAKSAASSGLVVLPRPTRARPTSAPSDAPEAEPQAPKEDPFTSTEIVNPWSN